MQISVLLLNADEIACIVLSAQHRWKMKNEKKNKIRMNYSQLADS